MMTNVDQIAREHFLRMLKRSILVLILLLTLIVLITERHKLLLLIDHPINKISVAGEFKYQSEEVLKEHVGHYLNEGFLSVDLIALKRFVESLPWVYNSTVSRIWPGEISIQIEEQVAVSYWNSKGLINAQGDLFLPHELPKALTLPVLQSERSDSQEERVKMYRLFNYIQNELSVFGLSASRLKQEVRGTWRITLLNGIDVVLGHLDLNDSDRKALDNKLERVGKLFSSRDEISPEKVSALDTRYPNGIAVEWRKIADN